MSFLDKILNMMKVNDDYDEDDFLGDDDVEEEERPKRSFFKRGSRGGSSSEPLDFPDEPDDEPIMRKFTKAPSEKTVKTSIPKTKPTVSTTSSKVSPIRTRKSAADRSVCVIKPTHMNDTREITETLLADCTVLLNLEGLDVDLAQRIIDFTAGSCYAISGNLQKVSRYIFIITPASVDVSGDLQDLLGGILDIATTDAGF